MNRGAESNAEISNRRRLFEEQQKDFDDFFIGLDGTRIRKLKFSGYNNEMEIIFDDNTRMYLLFSNSMVKLDRNLRRNKMGRTFRVFKVPIQEFAILTKIEVEKNREQMIAKYFQLIIQKSQDNLKYIEMHTDYRFPFESTTIRNCLNLECGFMDQRMFRSISSEIMIYGFLLAANMFEFEKMRAKTVSCDHICGNIHVALNGYLRRFAQNQLTNVMDNIDMELYVPKTGNSENENEEEEEEEERMLQPQLKNVLGGFETVDEPNITPQRINFAIRNQNHYISVECYGKNFSMALRRHF
ncbi:unnamed protein product [Caenorhabditis angaria]|uniref:Uncharacterized protein n=1 Tax=Caenorhabditis angaria TaxID=860376 RepID=A0A9P1N0L2_9PELO|nr:unnamed protein product [Caenorhabditis angaria]